MKWPTVDPKELFEELEERLGITKEVDDIRQTSLGAYPSESFYSQKEPRIDLAQMRTEFDKAAKRY